jgi:hypothetical protein
MWHALRHQSKCHAQHDDDDSSDESKRSRLNLDDDYSSTTSNSVNPPHPINYTRTRAQGKGKKATTTSYKSPIMEKSMVHKLYMTSQRMSKFKLFGQFTKMSDRSIVNI